MKKLLLYFSFVLLFAPLCLLAQERMTPELLWELGRVSDVQVSPNGEQILFGITRYDVEANSGNTDLYVMPVSGGEPKRITDYDGAEFNARWRPDGQKIGFLAVADGSLQLHEVNPNGADEHQITRIDGGIANFSYAPDGKHISFTREVKVEKSTSDIYPDLPKANARIIDDLMYRHWDKWSDASYNHIFYMAYENGEVKGQPVDITPQANYDTPMKPFDGPGEITWSPNGHTIAYATKKMSGKDYAMSTNSDIYLYNIHTEETNNLTDGMSGYDKHPAYSHSGEKIAWLSMKREGYESDKNVIWIYNMESGDMKAFSANFPETISAFVWSEDDEKIFFLSGTEATYQLFEVPVKDELAPEDFRQITEGRHNYGSIAQAGKHLIGIRQSMSAASEIFKIDIRNGKQEPLTTINEDIYDQIEMGQVRKRMIKTTDGKDMLTWVIYPPDFDSTKKYPTLLYCQGGPQSAVSQFFSFRWNFQLMAANDYIIVAPNRRGLPTFGTEWNEQISQDWGGQAMKDYLSAIDEVANEPYVDGNKLGAVGASYGGYSVYYLAGIHQERFKTFISHCGLFNLESWYGTTEELFFANWDIGGPYWEKPTPKSYKLFSPHDFVENWDTPIMVIHGGKDFRVPESEGMQAFQAAQLKGIPSKFLYFPEEGHWILSPQNGLLWHREFFSWLDKWLK